MLTFIDTGDKLIQWNGKNSSFQNRAKTRMVLARINKGDKVGKAEIIEIGTF